ncbi:PEGA domain-containing protein [Candidatus Neomarinimicrobiota bacterium]
MILSNRITQTSLVLGFLVSMLCAQSDFMAILDLDGRGISSSEAASLTDRLRSELVRTGRITVVERGQMERVLAEQDFQMAGCTSDECAVEVGQLLGVTEMVAGSIGKVGSTFSLDIRVINVATGVITNSIIRDYRGEIDGLLAEMRVLAEDLADLSTTVAEPEPPPPATMSIITEPVGAQVTLNSEAIGNTPIDTLELEPAMLQSVVLSFEGYESADTTFTTAPGQHHDLKWTLVPLKSWLTVTSNPTGAVTLLSGRKIGNTPVHTLELEPGMLQSVVLSLEGYETADTTFTTAPGQHHEVSWTLVPLKSWLTVTSNPTGAATVLSGRRIGRTPIDQYEIDPGKSYTLIVQLTDYTRVDTTFTAIPDEHTRLNIPLKRVPIATPPPVQAKAQPSVRSKGKGRWIVMAVIMAAGGYYGYTEGWFDSGDDGTDMPAVGQPPGVPIP